MQAVSTQSASFDELALFLQQVEELVNRRHGPPQPWHEMTLLGLLPTTGETPVWQDFSQDVWFSLLRGMACQSPALAILLSSARRVTQCQGDPQQHAFAHHARQNADGQWQLMLPATNNAISHWHFQNGNQILQVATHVLAVQHEPCDDSMLIKALCPPTACLAVGVATVPSCYQDVLAIWSGVLYRVWKQSALHAENRPMFRRHLADFPPIQYRLLTAMTNLLWADELIARLMQTQDETVIIATLPDIHRRAQAIWIETQQICGGSGYMLESDYGQSLVWFNWCRSILQQTPATDSPLAMNEQESIRQHITDHLRGMGVDANIVKSLLNQISQ